MADHSHVTEEQAREQLKAADLGDLELITIGRFLPGREGEYPAFYVICSREEAPFAGRIYSIHTAVIRERSVSLQTGTYDLTLDEATNRLPR